MSSIPPSSPVTPIPIEVPPIDMPPDVSPPPEVDDPPLEPSIPVREPGTHAPAQA